MLTTLCESWHYLFICEVICVFFYKCYFGYHVRLWLWPCVYSLMVESWLFVLEYMSLYWSHRWCFIVWLEDVRVVSMCFYNGMHYELKVKYVVSCLGWLGSLTWCIYEYEYVKSLLRMLKLLVMYVWMTWDLKWC